MCGTYLYINEYLHCIIQKLMLNKKKSTSFYIYIHPHLICFPTALHLCNFTKTKKAYIFREWVGSNTELLFQKVALWPSFASNRFSKNFSFLSGCWICEIREKFYSLIHEDRPPSLHAYGHMYMVTHRRMYVSILMRIYSSRLAAIMCQT